MDWLKAIAPTVASALGGPLAGLAVTALTKALGVDEAEVKDIMASGTLNGEQLAKVKVAEIELQKVEKELDLKFADLEAKDRDSARQREMSVKDNTNMVLAYTIVGSFVAMVGAALLGYAKVESALAGTLVGYLSAKAEQVLAYYFGSSRGSEMKSQLLAKAPPIK